MKPTHIIGIDNGITGGLALLNMAGNLITATTMPVYFDGHLNANRIFPRLLLNCLKTLHNDAAYKDHVMRPPRDLKILVAIELCPRHSRSKNAMRSMAISWGLAISTIELAGYEWTSANSGNSKASWQRCLLGRLEKDQTKPAAIALARELWPHESFIPQRCRKPDTGMVDAALIAEHIRRIHL